MDELIAVIVGGLLIVGWFIFAAICTALPFVIIALTVKYLFF